MVRLKFTVDKDYLLAHTLSSSKIRFSSTEYKEDVLALQRRGLEILSKGGSTQSDSGLQPEVGFQLLFNFFPDIKSLLTGLKDTQEFQQILTQVQQYQREIEKQWASNYPETLKMMRDITGLKWNGAFTVYLTHPSLSNARYMSRRKIAWGCAEQWDNYSTVYLWHEIMHHKLPTSEIAHSVIQLATDNELRVRLNGREYPPFLGHELLFPYMEKMLPYWKEYLSLPRRNILKFNRRMDKMFGF